MNRCRHRGFQFHEYLNNYYHGLIYWLSSDKWQYEGHLSQLCESIVQPKHFPEWRTMLRISLDTRRLSCSSWQVWWISVLQSADDCICNILKCVVFPESLYPLILYLISDHMLLYVLLPLCFGMWTWRVLSKHWRTLGEVHTYYGYLFTVMHVMHGYQECIKERR